MAGNPTNYSRLGILSSVEAVAATLFILGDEVEADAYLALYKWGPTFMTLNSELLTAYKSARDELEVHEIEKSYFPRLFLA